MKTNYFVSRLLLALAAFIIVFSLSQIVSPNSHWWWLALSFLLIILIAGYDYFESKQKKAKVDLMVKKLTDLTTGKKTSHIILEHQDPYYHLAQAINAVQSMQRDFSKDYTKQQRGYFSLLEYITIGVLVIDQEREVYLSNHTLNELLGKEIDQKGRIYYTLLGNFELVKLVEDTFRNHKDQHTQLTLNLDGSDKIVDVQVIYVPLSEQQFFVMLLLDDVTETKQIEQMQKDFVSNVSHELKTPITAITGFSETLLQGALEDPAIARQFVQIIHDESNKLTDLINDILSLSRIEAKHDLTLETFNFNEFVVSLLQSFTVLLNKQQITVNNLLPTDLVVVCDKVKLRHIVNNLLQNAIRYNKVGGQIVLTAGLLEDEWYFSIQDTGIGIKKDEQDRVFERFYRVDSSRSKEIGGTGLGLAIVKEYVESLSGTISLVSRFEQGSTFTVNLPRFLEN